LSGRSVLLLNLVLVLILLLLYLLSSIWLFTALPGIVSILLEHTAGLWGIRRGLLIVASRCREEELLLLGHQDTPLLEQLRGVEGVVDGVETLGEASKNHI